MKNLETKAINQLLAILPNHPAIRIMHFCDGGEAFCLALKTMCQEREYEYQLNIVDADFYEKAQELYAQEGVCATKLVKWEQRRYASMARLYDFLFVTAFVPDEHEEAFIENVFHHIKSAGNIIIFLPKNEPKVLQRWWELLEEKYFVAINTIDIFEHYELLVAKKMHGWGGS